MLRRSVRDFTMFKAAVLGMAMFAGQTLPSYGKAPGQLTGCEIIGASTYGDFEVLSGDLIEAAWDHGDGRLRIATAAGTVHSTRRALED